MKTLKLIAGRTVRVAAVYGVVCGLAAVGGGPVAAVLSAAALTWFLVG